VVLQIYALFKQGSGETKFEDAPKPGMFDLKVSRLRRTRRWPMRMPQYDMKDWMLIFW
jgi:hypothetical protein